MRIKENRSFPLRKKYAARTLNISVPNFFSAKRAVHALSPPLNLFITASIDEPRANSARGLPRLTADGSEQLVVVLANFRKHIIDDGDIHLFVADSHADTRKRRQPRLAYDAAHAVVRARAAARTDAEFSLGQIVIVVDDEKPLSGILYLDISCFTALPELFI